MNEARVRKLLRGGEGLNVEFKTCRDGLSKTIYETISAFLNRNGGEILLGVDDRVSITGIDENIISKIKAELITALNNPSKITPPFYLMPEEIRIDGKQILYLYVPASSQVHRCNGRIYDRNGDGDLDITDNTNLVTSLYLRKQVGYSENRVYPFVAISDIRPDLIQRARKLASIQRPGHPWSGMDDFELLRSTQLYRKDYQTGDEGYTLAAVLLLGSDELIMSVLPHHRTDIILRRGDTDRYDDRDDVRTNLIDSYDRLMAFVAKHLPDKFYQEGSQRISIREHVFRELIANMSIHREYLNPFPAKLVIGDNKIYSENSNKPHGHGLINPTDFTPFPKNPAIADFFRQIGLAEELGSGFRKMYKYGKIYFGIEPVLTEGDIFRFEVFPVGLINEPAEGGESGGESNSEIAEITAISDNTSVGGESEKEWGRVNQILTLLRDTNLSKKEIAKLLGKQEPTRYLDDLMKKMVEDKLIEYTIPEKPNSRLQKYALAHKITALSVHGLSDKPAGGESGGESERGLEDQVLIVLKDVPLSKKEIAARLGKSHPTRYIDDLIKKMTKSGLIEYTIPEKPNSRLQKYRLSKKG